ncbi:N-acetyltransferase, putative [Ricinus communis]|uniref:N-acetyltransferase, putative n=1 Tax=Ricinus communis TaxID=3988 RepID=B9RTP6_RICCO|nr:N-acetyltransferase, putative [Ricinus communis]
MEKFAIPHPWRRSICLDDYSIGYVSISPESGNARCRAHLGYAVAAEFWGQGIATTALKMAMSSVGNIGSLKVVEKVGYLKEGLLRKYGYCKGEIRDMFVYSFLSTDKVL